MAILSMSPNYTLDENGRHLRIEFVTPDDAGTYSCLARNSVESNELNFTLDVLTPPKLHANGSDHSEAILSGQAVLLKCPVSGNPDPQIKWTRQIGDNVSAEHLPIDNSALVN